MTSLDDLEALYGPLARHSENKRGDRIRYLYDGHPTTGAIIWVCAAAPDRGLQVNYLVENDERDGIPDCVLPSEVVA